ncbi:FAD-binding oxidoreductase [Fuscibacter oryzae]|uniref:FAD-binding oxidoreductase n=1 Tax=Fuscibacter oryzae TaxID=2803939 RepID=A0A8J7MQK3_9RHOB|nr:FAD-binding oxidoreductase [Fuscibacter oryzae]MBL4926995.1 FAD-binding oxidoreductase [Fuscibacter oryzae]
MSLHDDLVALLGASHVLTGDDLARYRAEWSGHYSPNPAIVARPASTAEVAGVVQIAARHGVPVVPVSGLTGLVGGAMTTGGLMVSVERLNRIREIRSEARTAVVEAGVILSRLHDAAARQGMYFPLWFGARGSAMIGGVLSTNAGGSNVLRYGSTRALCLGLEVVLADGRVLNLMSELHKDNSGYDLKQLFIGAEGTLGIITAAVMKLVPAPRAYATATLAARSLPDALALLNRLREVTGGLVEAFEYMPATYMQRLAEARPDVALPFGGQRYETNILVEIAATAPRDAAVAEDGTVPLTALLEETLGQLIEEGAVLDAEIAQNEAQRLTMWHRRELAAEITIARQPTIDTDIALPLHLVPEFFARIEARLPALDPGCDTLSVAHLGDGNIHYTVYPTRDDPALYDAVVEAVEDVVQDLHGSFSAEHGVGLSKLATMKRRKDPVALAVMRAIKQSIDPENRMNPGKVIPE